MDTTTGKIYSDLESEELARRGVPMENITLAEERILRGIPEENRVAALAAIRKVGASRLLGMSMRARERALVAAGAERRPLTPQESALDLKGARPHPAARIEGESDEDHRANRNAMKRARRARRAR